MNPYSFKGEPIWASNVNFTPTAWASSSTPRQIRGSQSGLRNYVQGLQLETDTLGAATSLWLLDGSVSVSAATVATPGVFTSGTHDFNVGDAIVFQNLSGLTITGVSANQVVWVVSTPSTTTFTVALTPGGTGVAVTVTGTATVYRILYIARLQTTSLIPTQINLPIPLKSAPNATISALASGTTTGTIHVSAQGVYGL